MVRSTWDALVAGYSPDDVALLSAYRDLVGSLDGVEERVHAKEIDFAVKRVFTSAYVKSHWLEVGIELTRVAAGEPHLRAHFSSGSRTTMHRFTLSTAAQLKKLTPLLVESRDAVGPGFR
jgi:hypothetical protein